MAEFLRASFPAHLLYDLLAIAAWKVIAAAGIATRALFALTFLNALFAALGVAVFARILMRTGHGTFASVACTLGLAFSGGYWMYASNLEDVLPALVVWFLALDRMAVAAQSGKHWRLLAGGNLRGRVGSSSKHVRRPGPSASALVLGGERRPRAKRHAFSGRLRRGWCRIATARRPCLPAIPRRRLVRWLALLRGDAGPLGRRRDRPLAGARNPGAPACLETVRMGGHRGLDGRRRGSGGGMDDLPAKTLRLGTGHALAASAVAFRDRVGRAGDGVRNLLARRRPPSFSSRLPRCSGCLWRAQRGRGAAPFSTGGAAALAAFFFTANLIQTAWPDRLPENNEALVQARMLGEMTEPGDLILTPAFGWVSVHGAYFARVHVESFLRLGLRTKAARGALIEALDQLAQTAWSAGGTVYLHTPAGRNGRAVAVPFPDRRDEADRGPVARPKRAAARLHHRRRDVLPPASGRCRNRPPPSEELRRPQKTASGSRFCVRGVCSRNPVSFRALDQLFRDKGTALA